MLAAVKFWKGELPWQKPDLVNDESVCFNSGPDDNVFIFFTDHGATGLVAFPNGVVRDPSDLFFPFDQNFFLSFQLYAKDLNKTLSQMNTQKKYSEVRLSSLHAF